MFESLQDGLKSAFKSIRGQGKLTESNMREGLKLVEQSLLEADVSYQVVQDFMGRVSAEALGERVLTSLKPQDQLISIVNSELINLLGSPEDTLSFKSGVNVFMMCGLQGSGKTTTCGKLASLLKSNFNKKALLVAADLQRPAAIEQLHVIGKQVGVEVYSQTGEQDPVKVCREAVAHAKENNVDVVILDTAGRLAIDQELMDQLKRIDNQVNPDQVFLVVDGMTGQDAVNSAKAFHEALELNGVVMTKLDGDARGGALLSVRSITGVPIRFIGTGEHLNDLEYFRPDGMAQRILGFGDIVAAADEARRLFDEKEQEKLQKQLEKGEFTLDDFRNHMQKMAQPGLIQKMMGLMPGMGQVRDMMNQMQDVDTSRDIRRMVAIIDSMTPQERKDRTVIDVSRLQRIAQGSGSQPQQVNELIKQYDTMKPMLTMTAGKSANERMQMVQELQEKMMDPSRGMPKTKKGTGRRLSADERKKAKKDREKLLRQKRRDKKRKK